MSIFSHVYISLSIRRKLCGNLFQGSTTLQLKKFYQHFLFGYFLNNLQSCTLNCVADSTTNWLESMFLSSLIILKVLIMFPLDNLLSTLYRFSLTSLSSCSILLVLWLFSWLFSGYDCGHLRRELETERRQFLQHWGNGQIRLTKKMSVWFRFLKTETKPKYPLPQTTNGNKFFDVFTREINSRQKGCRFTNN